MRYLDFLIGLAGDAEGGESGVLDDKLAFLERCNLKLDFLKAAARYTHGTGL